jgi:TFIIF-interacting CTD phosphatase-like protein
MMNTEPTSTSTTASKGVPSYHHDTITTTATTGTSTANTSTHQPSHPIIPSYNTQPNLHLYSNDDDDIIGTHDDNENEESKTNEEEEEEVDPLIVVLDLDECLIHSHFLHSSIDAALFAHQLQQEQQQHRRRKNNATRNTKSFDSFRIVLQEETPRYNYMEHPNMHHGPNLMEPTTHVHVFLRPGCLEFLAQVTQLYPTYIYTAAQSIYANPILNHLSQSVRILRQKQQQQQQQQQVNPSTNSTTAASTTTAGNCIFRGRFYREHCKFDSKAKEYYKDLTSLHRHNHRYCQISSETHKMVLIDNNPVSLLQNPSNGILVDSFYGPFQPDPEPDIWPDDSSYHSGTSSTTRSQPTYNNTDQTFTNLLPYLQELSSVSDVRPVIQRDKQHWFTTGYSWAAAPYRRPPPPSPRPYLMTIQH